MKANNKQKESQKIEFFKLFFSILVANMDIKNKDFATWEMAEKQWEKITGANRYKNYGSFRKCKSVFFKKGQNYAL